uniref:Uncharacterized protein n=1 Tax=Medicago truncatula TaxID=3880 RepID=Q2HTH0_MEDTR|nr:hypothetical protein MtrDRAFT_AC150441g19v1 [Medicago truncatula]
MEVRGVLCAVKKGESVKTDSCPGKREFSMVGKNSHFPGLWPHIFDDMAWVLPHGSC